MENVEHLRKELLEIQKKRNDLVEHGKRTFKELIVVLDAETDVNKRKELIDYLFADNVEEIYEYHFRKEYLN